MEYFKAVIDKINLCRKTKEQHDIEYFAMRRNEPIPKTICEQINEFVTKEWKWLIGVSIAIIGILTKIL